MGEAKRRGLQGSGRAERAVSGAVTLDTFAGKLHVEWDPAAPVTRYSGWSGY